MRSPHWERLGAASGIVAAILFGVSLIIFLGSDPTDLPDLRHAGDYAKYVREHQEALKVQVLLNSLAIVLFVWFLGSLWSRLRAAEGGPARVSAIAFAGGIAGAVAVLMGFVFEACSALAPTTVDVTTLYVMAALSVGLGAAAFTVFFLAIARVILATRVLPAAIGILALVAGAASALGFATIFADDGVFNAATGAFGFWLRFGAFVVWLALTSITLTATVDGRASRRR